MGTVLFCPAFGGCDDLGQETISSKTKMNRPHFVLGVLSMTEELMTERENLAHVLRRDGKARWLPIVDDCLQPLMSSPDMDRPVFGTDGFDWFGCHWTHDPILRGYVQTPSCPFPLSDIGEWRKQVRFPDLDAPDWQTAAHEDLARFDRKNKMLFIKTESGPFERLHQLYGFENAFIAMYDEPEAFWELLDALTEFRIGLYHKIGRYYQPDLVIMMDDLGSGNGPLLSLDMYRTFIKPFDARIVEAIHRIGAFAVYHSCGNMQVFIQDLLEIGADVLHPFQGGINDQEKAEADYGNKVVFCNCLDNLVHLPETSEEALRQEMRRVMNLFWKKRI
jgi:hypothetical protein